MTNECSITLSDPYLNPFKDHFVEIDALYRDKLAFIENIFGSIEAFADSYKTYGLHVDGEHVTYKEWAPGLKRVSLMGEFNNWQRHQIEATRDSFGTWFIDTIIPGFIPDTKVKLAVTLEDGSEADKIPLFTFRTTQEPKNPKMDCLATPDSKFEFVHAAPAMPANPRIYESHVGISSEEPGINTYRKFADEVLPHIQEAGYNVVQLMAVAEHSYYASFGYHVTSFFSPASRSGHPDDLRYLIDKAHSMGMCVIMDLVHAHASKNVEDGINRFDGTDSHFFHAGGKGNHDLWDSRLFNYDNVETLRYLLSNIAYWMNSFRFDGFRMDGITSMLYLHHGIGHGFTGNYSEYFNDLLDKESVVYLKLATTLMRKIKSDVLIIAEDVSGIPTLCRPIEEGGMGFTHRLAMAIPDMWIKLLKEYSDDEWNMGNIVYTLCNRRRDEPVIAYAESHDQAIVGDKTILMWLLNEEIYTNMSVLQTPTERVSRGIALHKLIRLLTMGLGGDAWLTFMGNDFGHPEWLDFPRIGNNWSYSYARRQWSLAKCPHLRYQHLFNFDKTINQIEEKHRFLSKTEYVTYKHESDKIISWDKGDLVFVVSLNPSNAFTDYRIPVRQPGKYTMVMNSDELDLGGFGRYRNEDFEAFSVPENYCGQNQFINMYLAPRTAFVLQRHE